MTTSQDRILTLIRNNPMTVEEIATELNLSQKTVRNRIAELRRVETIEILFDTRENQRWVLYPTRNETAMSRRFLDMRFRFDRSSFYRHGIGSDLNSRVLVRR